MSLSLIHFKTAVKKVGKKGRRSAKLQSMVLKWPIATIVGYVELTCSHIARVMHKRFPHKFSEGFEVKTFI